MSTATQTPITTAARRIARDVNATASTVRTAYDTEGRPVHTWQDGMYFAAGAVEEVRDAAAALTGTKGTGRRCTERDAQDMIDATAHARRVTGFAHPVVIGDYLADLEQARDAR
ncbi:hypothetical protein [Cellulomonas sp. HD19AZ1]|uniref:hypothetical protein n=1 Tax=Cellulomonas sp. HD19AZ1 TaxID=2559593 RepID=UPI00107141A5|nr:hypothetical protein [Cellulomonas sp. HD19AZ1]TFH68139.1 hypothetical protein E4A51_18005 [Cellulomonas sp. HD19AZ1]